MVSWLPRFRLGNTLSLAEAAETFSKVVIELEANMSMILGTWMLTLWNGCLSN